MTRKNVFSLIGASLASTLLSGRAIGKTIAASSASPVGRTGLPVAFVVGPLANVIDLAGPYEVFSDTSVYYLEYDRSPTRPA